MEEGFVAIAVGSTSHASAERDGAIGLDGEPEDSQIIGSVFFGLESNSRIIAVSVEIFREDKAPFVEKLEVRVKRRAKRAGSVERGGKGFARPERQSVMVDIAILLEQTVGDFVVVQWFRDFGDPIVRLLFRLRRAGGNVKRFSWRGSRFVVEADPGNLVR